MNELNITVSQLQGEVPVTILHVSGHLHGDTEAELLAWAQKAQEEGSKHLLLDLSGVEVLNSVGLRAIHNIFRLFTPQRDLEIIQQHREEPYKSPYFKLVCPNPNVYYVLNIAGFLQSLLIYNDLDEAINSFTS
jgi:anti-anti-sigma factor